MSIETPATTPTSTPSAGSNHHRINIPFVNSLNTGKSKPNTPTSKSGLEVANNHHNHHPTSPNKFLDEFKAVIESESGFESPRSF